MTGYDWLAERFEEDRGHLRAVAYHILGSVNEADDAIQETWLRLIRSDASAIETSCGMADDRRRARMLGHAALAHFAPRRVR